MLRTDDLDYELPEELIATRPVEPRDSARLLAVHRENGCAIEHCTVRDLPRLLRRGDLLVMNTTRVLPARFLGVRMDTGGKAEGLFVRELEASVEGDGGAGVQGPIRWQVLLKMRRMKEGVVVGIVDGDGRDLGVKLRLVERVGSGGKETSRIEEPHPGVEERVSRSAESRHAREGKDEDGGWVVEVEGTTGRDARAILEVVGLTPIPPYIAAARRKHEIRIADDRDRATYQTVYAGDDAAHAGSVAAPTAGLHFTPRLLEMLDAAGVERAEVVLHVGLGTFKPVETEFVEQHTMHAEWCAVPRATAEAIERTRARDGRVIAVGTTTARTLESFESVEQMLAEGEKGKQTRLLITPGYGGGKFKHVDALMTNFHLPRSTLMALVAAMMPGADAAAQIAALKRVYGVAVEERYRFYSYGDGMLVL